MASSMLCDPCQLQDKHNEASEWCPDCEEGLCAECTIHHRSSKALRSHNLVQISVMSELPSDLTSEEVCIKHDQLRIEYLCTSHDELCCRACLTDKHKPCSHVIAIDLACKNAKIDLLKDTKSETKHIIETLESAHKETEIKLSNMNTNSQKIRLEIAEAKSEAINRLEEAETALVNELNNKTDKFNSEVQNKIEKGKDLRKSATEKLKQIEFVEKHGTEKQAFFLSQKFKSYLNEVEASIQELTSINSVTLGFDTTEATNPLVGVITKTEGTEQITKYTPLKQRQAQFNVESSKPLTLFQIIFKFKILCKFPNMLGMIATDDGKLLLCNHKNTHEGGGIYIYDQTGHHIKNLSLDWPFDIAYIQSKDQFAVTLTNSRSVQFICANSLEFLDEKKLDCKGNIYGIAATENKLYIGSIKSKVIEINTDDTTRKVKAVNLSGNIYYIEKTKKNIYVSSDEGISTMDKRKPFLCLDGKCKKIVVDKHDYVYVAVSGKRSYIQRLTPGLKPDININIDSGEGIWGICFNEDCSKLFIANNRGRSIVTMNCS